MIKPTVGRKVWYRPHTFERTHTHAQPFDATITHVWSDTCVNLLVFNENGVQLLGKTSVRLAQDVPAQPGECEWMPYPVGQAQAAAPVPEPPPATNAYVESGSEPFAEGG